MMPGIEWQGMLTIAMVLGTLGLLLWERFTPDRVMIGAVAVLALAGVLTPREALQGFWNPGLLTVAVLFVLVAALKTTGAIGWIGGWVLGRPAGERVALARLVPITSALSAFINNTPVVAMLTSSIEHWSRISRVSPSRLLLPMNYATILGGMCTLVGTSTNLVVAGLVATQTSLPKLKMFDPLLVALPAVVLGGVYLATAGRWLLPARRSALDQAADTYEYAVEMLVEPGGALTGKSIDEARLRSLSGSYLVELVRDGELFAAVTPDTRLQANDRLVFVGVTDAVRELRRIDGLRPATDQLFKLDSADSRRTLVELVLSPYSPVIGKTLREAAFRTRYNAAVIAVSRRGQRLHDKPGDVVLQAGDTLLVETVPPFMHTSGQSADFLVATLVDGVPAVDPNKARMALGVLMAMIVANTVLGVDILTSAMAAAVLVVALRCVSLPELRRTLDLRLVAVIACSFALGEATEKTGVAAVMATQLNGLAGADPFWTLALVYLVAVMFTELLTNNAAAVLIFPIGISAAAQLGVNAMPFVMAVMIGASAGFVTPIGYQTNLMVYGPGGYRFGDYLRFGAPLSLLVGVVVLWTIPRVWPF
jgi:di/tricarboxylate transporter